MIHTTILYILLFSALTILQANGERTKDKMYEEIQGTAACFRRLNATHQIGCSSDRSGSTGVIHMVGNASDVDWAVHSGLAGPYMLVMPLTMLTWDLIHTLQQNPDKVSGIIVHNNITEPKQWSLEESCPNSGSGLGREKCPIDGWNPWGTGMLRAELPVPVFLLDDLQSLESIAACHHKHNAHDLVEQPLRSLCALELSSFMFAAKDSRTCIRRADVWTTFNQNKQCDPLGDKNVWYSLRGWRGEGSTPEALMVVARMDTTGLFSDRHPGAHGTVAGLVTLMVTAELVKRIIPPDTQIKRNIFFVLLNGESYDYIGSQRLVYDMLNRQFPKEREEQIQEELDHLLLEQVGLLVEIGQLRPADRKPLYLHRLAAPNTVKELEDALVNNSKRVKFRVGSSENYFPPASIQSFVQERPDIPAVLITDHDQQFTNRYYNSLYDTPEQLNFTYVNVSAEEDGDGDGDGEGETDGQTEDGRRVFEGSVQQWLADVSSELARALHPLVTGRPYAGNQTANVYYVNELLHCYLDTVNCNMFKAVTLQQEGISRKEEPLSMYVGVTSSLNTLTDPLTGRTLAWLTGERLGPPAAGNVTKQRCAELQKDHRTPEHQYFWMAASLGNISEGAAVCFRTTVNYSLAISPVFGEIKGYRWESGRYSSWSESVWSGFSVRMYLRPSARHELLTISVGAAALVLAAVLARLLHSRADTLFPRASAAAAPPATC